MTDNNIQQRVYDAVCARGYRAGWTPQQFLARQIAKLQEELAEASYSVTLNSDDLARDLQERAIRPAMDTGIDHLILDAGEAARRAFGDPSYWGHVEMMIEPEYIRRELADMLVVIFCAVEALREIDGQEFDVIEAALDKSTADVARGVRK